jgi:choline dehydrogenase-like flavoprotein
MIDDLEQNPDGATVACQVAVVGAGAVGLVLAVVLARRGVDVALLESGGKQFESAAQDLNSAVVTGRPHTGVFEGRARVLGGTTTLWGGQLVAFSDIDFEQREWVANSGWPIGPGDLRPYYRNAADLLDLAVKDNDDTQVWQGLGLEAPSLGEEFDVILTRWLRETNLARYFADDLKSRSNLRVMLHATAIRLGFDRERSRVTDLVARSLSGRQVRVIADTVVIANGTIEASRLMLASARCDSTMPWAENPWVGACFQDHLDTRAARVHPLDGKAFGDFFDNIYLKGFKYNPKIHLRDQVQRDHRLVNIAASFSFDSSMMEHLSNIKIFANALRRGSIPPNLKSVPAHIGALGRIWWPLVMRYLKDHRAFNPSERGIHLILHCEQMPLRESTIRLDEELVDKHDVPSVKLDWRVDGREIETMAYFCETLKTRLLKGGLARLEIDARLAARDPALLEDCRDSNHQCGGLRMATSVEHGVVDSDLRVFETENLYVTGAPAFPSSSFANPTYTAFALTLRLADHLMEAGLGTR